MPSPLAHGLAGLAIGFAAEPSAVAQTSRRRLSSFAVVGAVIAALPDLDLIHSGLHRGASHSVGATALLMIIAAGVTGWATGRVQWRWGLLLGAGHAAHLLQGWSGSDRFAPTGARELLAFKHPVCMCGLVS